MLSAEPFERPSQASLKNHLQVQPEHLHLHNGQEEDENCGFLREVQAMIRRGPINRLGNIIL
jgi:hypothetical protein